ncbi:MAG: hypothetical protein P4K98_01940 [Bryobacteraceae bacterium]|nr:hypothetical protein [Bryobacteraceae bacterium]
MEVVGRKIGELEQELADARDEGKALFTEFRKRQGDLAGSFGFSGAVTFERQKGTRAPRSAAANIAVGGSRMVTNAYKAGKSQGEARKAGLERALELAKKNSLTAVPAEVVTMIEATVKRRYTKVK